MTPTPSRRDQANADQDQQRALALQDAADMTRRAAAAMLAAACGEPNQLRCDSLHVMHRALLSLLAEMQAMA